MLTSHLGRRQAEDTWSGLKLEQIFQMLALKINAFESLQVCIILNQHLNVESTSAYVNIEIQCKWLIT